MKIKKKSNLERLLNKNILILSKIDSEKLKGGSVEIFTIDDLIG